MTAIRWLSSSEMAAWRLNLLSWQLIDRALDQQLQRDFGIPHAYYAILVSLHEQREAPIPLTRLATNVGYSQSRMSHAIARLGELGWVARVQDPLDKRVVTLKLTADGRRTYSEASAKHIELVRESFFAQLDETDVSDLIRIGRKLFEGLTVDLPEASLFRHSASAVTP